MAKVKTYVVMGATSDVGAEVARRLKVAGQVVKPISRTAGVPVDDETALKQAFSGADAAYVMIPFDMGAPDLHKREAEIGAKLADAMTASGVTRVVFLSAASAHLRGHTGSGMGAAMMEERLDQLDLPELVHLRAGFFMENFLKGMGFAAQAPSGSYRTAFRGDRPMPMIASTDVAERVVNLLTASSFRQPRIQELLGFRDYTMAEATQILATAFGDPRIRYVQSSYSEARSAMLELGVSESFADAVMETSRSFNRGDTWAREPRSALNTTPTSLEAFAQTAFGKAGA